MCVLLQKNSKKGKLCESKSTIAEAQCRRLPEKDRKTVPSSGAQARTMKQKREALRQRPRERQQYDETVVKAYLRKHIKDAYKEKLREAIRNRVESYSTSTKKASSGLMHMVNEMHDNATDTRTVEVPGEFFNKTFARHLMVGTGEPSTNNERVHAFHENFAGFGFEGASIQGLRGYSHLRADRVPREPEEPFDHEPRTFHDTRRVCALPGPLSRGRDGPSSLPSRTIVSMNRE
jgi:hypothetical protein